MARLILHADDFGLHPAVNRAILEAAARGTISSASVLVNGPAVTSALSEARKIPELGVGLHLNILRGRPVSDPGKIPSLVDRQGRFLNSAPRLLARSLEGKLAADDIYTEFSQQYHAMLAHGFVPTHLDSEKHTHLYIPAAVQALARLQETSGLNKVRIIREYPVIAMLRKRQIAVPASLRQRCKLAFLEYRARRAASSWSSARSPDYTFGVLMSGNVRSDTALSTLQGLLSLRDDCTIEWMLHPGYSTELESPRMQEEFGRFFLTNAREEEHRFLVSDEAAAVAAEARNRIISYREL